MKSLEKHELWWRDHREWLESFGYKLRRRLFPGLPLSHSSDRSQHIEDVRMIMDATRIFDGKRVMLKKVGQDELEIAVFFKYSHDAITSDPRNHCVPISDVIEVPSEEDQAIIVTPYLRPFYTPRFETNGELLEFFRQLFEGVHFMHLYNVAYRSCTIQNISMEGDGMYPNGFHPIWPNITLACDGPAKQRSTRTRRPPKYYLSGFESSSFFPSSESHPLVSTSPSGGDGLPEYQDQLTPYDPFPADVFCLGSTIQAFLRAASNNQKAVYGFEFLDPLIQEMIHPEPSQRPTMEEVAIRYDQVLKLQSSRFVRSRVVYDGDKPLSLPKRVLFWARQLSYAARGIPALPTPK